MRFVNGSEVLQVPVELEIEAVGHREGAGAAGPRAAQTCHGPVGFGQVWPQPAADGGPKAAMEEWLSRG
jgi:hypothetical protein